MTSPLSLCARRYLRLPTARAHTGGWPSRRALRRDRHQRQSASSVRAAHPARHAHSLSYPPPRVHQAASCTGAPSLLSVPLLAPCRAHRTLGPLSLGTLSLGPFSLGLLTLGPLTLGPLTLGPLTLFMLGPLTLGRAVPCAQDARTVLARTAHARTVHARTELGPFTLHARSIARLASHVSHRMSRIACRIARLAWMSCFVLHAILSARLQRARSERTRPHPEPHRGRAWPA